MPRVISVKARATKAEQFCCKCGRAILPGQMIYRWSFRYGGGRVKHHSCGYPRPSELTQSRLGDVYAEREDAEDAIAKMHWNPEWGNDVIAAIQEIESHLAGVAEAAHDVSGEYREAAEHFGGTGDNADRAEDLESYISELEGWEVTDQEAKTTAENREAWLEDAKESAIDVLGSLTL